MAKSEIVSSEQTPNRFELGPVIAPVGFYEQLGVVIHYRLFIAVVALSITALGALYAYSKPSTYEANLLIQVADMRSVEPRSLLGSAAPGPGFKRAMSEVELLRSRAIVGTAVDKLQLDISATPRHFPFVGRMVADWNTRRAAPVGQAYGGYAWGAERIEAGVFEVPESLVGKGFLVTKTAPGRYRIQNEQSGWSSVGQVGKMQHFGMGQERIGLRIDALVGAPGARYTLLREPRIAVIEGITAALEVAELGKDTGMIKVGLQHTDPQLARAFLNELGHTYMDFVQGQRGEAVRETLDVLSAQLPLLKKRVEIAEARYEAYRRNEGATDLAEDTRLHLARYSETKSRLSELRQKRAELAVRLGDAHPDLMALDQQIAGVSRDGGAMAGAMQRIPGVATELERRARELKAQTDIYGSVLRRVEEMRVDVQDRSSNVRIVDEAVVPVQATESRLTVIVFAAILGIGIGMVGAFVRRLRAGMRRDTLFDAEQSEEHVPSRYAQAHA